jgi:hypothetical protein
MRHLVKSFQSHVGERGCHFYDAESCSFLSWSEVFKFADALAEREEIDPFANRLTETLANYNPDKEFLAVHQEGDSVSVELYTSAIG